MQRGKRLAGLAGLAGPVGPVRRGWRAIGVLRVGLLLACGPLAACSLIGHRELQANVALQPVGGGLVHGKASLTERGDAVQITYDVAGLAPNSLNSFVIHANGNCGGGGAMRAGPRFQGADLVPPALVGSNRHTADRLSRVWADSNGVAVGFFVMSGLSLDGVRSVVGRSLIVHQGGDSWVDDPAAAKALGLSPDVLGKPLACGVIDR